MASAMPMPQISPPLCPERSWKGNTASVLTAGVAGGATAAGAYGITGVRLER